MFFSITFFWGHGLGADATRFPEHLGFTSGWLVGRGGMDEFPSLLWKVFFWKKNGGVRKNKSTIEIVANKLVVFFFVNVQLERCQDDLFNNVTGVCLRLRDV